MKPFWVDVETEDGLTWNMSYSTEANACRYARLFDADSHCRVLGVRGPDGPIHNWEYTP